MNGCGNCAMQMARLQRAIRAQERRRTAGRPTDMAEVGVAKGLIAECKSRGHIRATDALRNSLSEGSV